MNTLIAGYVCCASAMLLLL